MMTLIRQEDNGAIFTFATSALKEYSREEAPRRFWSAP